MIGPHQGKELELMLAGKKHLAVFCEAVVEGVEISEEIIPENAFSPYVTNGQIERFSQDFFLLNCLSRKICMLLYDRSRMESKSFFGCIKNVLLANAPLTMLMSFLSVAFWDMKKKI
jgi:hypothetical protein